MIAADRQQRSREHGELMPGDCGGRLKKEKRMVISVPSARGGNCIPLICRLFRPSSELVLGPSRKFSQESTALRRVYEDLSIRVSHLQESRNGPVVQLRKFGEYRISVPQQPPEPARVPTGLHPHPHLQTLLLQLAIELLCFFPVKQAPFAPFARVGVDRSFVGSPGDNHNL
jgi:hypothetical protein